MRVRLTDLPPSGLVINETIPLEPLNDRMSLGRSIEVKFATAPKVKIIISKTVGGVELSGSVESSYTQTCSRCADDLPRQIDLPLHLILQQHSESASPATLKEEVDDVGLCYFSGDAIELDDIFYEQLILSLDQYYHPPEDAHGRCTACSRQCTVKSEAAPKKNTISLGVLLEAAKQKAKN